MNSNRWLDSRAAPQVVGLLVGIGLVLRLYQLGNGLWLDEIETLVEHVRAPLADIISSYPTKNNHPLYSILAHASVSLLGESAFSLRLPAALLGTASLAAFYLLATRVTSRREALLGTALLTFSYHHVWFSQNARGYSGLLCFTLLATTAFLQLLQDERHGRGPILRYAVTTALAVYLHPTAALLAVSHALILAGVWWRIRRTDRRAAVRPVAGLLLAGVLSLLLYVPMLSEVITTLAGPNPHGATTEWQSPLWFLLESARGLATGLPGGWLSVALGGLVLGAGLVSFWKQRPLLVALFLLPGALTAVTILFMRQNLWPRFFFFSAGFAVLIAIRGGFELCRLAFRGRGTLLATGGAILATLGSAFTVPRAWHPKQDFLGAEAFVDRSRARDDAVVTVDLTVYPYLRWRRREWAVADSLPSLEALELRHRRTWVLYTFPIRLAAVQPAIWARLATRYDTAAVYPGTVGGGAVVVMVSRATSSAP